MTELYEFGINLIQAIQTLSPALDGLMKLLTFMGTIEFFLILIPILYWLVEPRLGLRVLLLLISVDVIGSYAKILLHEPRPYWIGDVKQMSVEKSYGIPSTHASNTLAVWAFLAWVSRRRWLWIAGLSLAFLISLSRLYLGVHFPQDVVGGWLIGLVVLYLFTWGERRFGPTLAALSPAALIGLAFGLAVLVALGGLAVRAMVAGVVDPEDWLKFTTPEEARSPAHFFTIAGALFGAITGYVLLCARLNYWPTNDWGRRVIAFLLGMVGVVVFWQGLDILFSALAEDETTLGYIFRFIRYGTTTLWATYAAPWVFIRLGLAGSSGPTPQAAIQS